MKSVFVMATDLNLLMLEVEDVVRQAGALLLSHFRTDDLIVMDKSAGNPVTEADLASEKFLVTNLGKLLPHASFFTEESLHNLSDGYSWVIDPLDGTVNFSRGLDYFCISVALAYQNKPILGCIYRPVGDEFFSAINNHGSFLKSEKKSIRLCVRSGITLDKAFASICLPYKNGGFDSAIAVFGSLAHSCYAVRKMGSAALDQAYVACGRLDVSVLMNLGWWDVAAGMLLIEEAGGVVTDFSNAPIGPDYKSYLATSPLLHKQVQHLLYSIDITF